MFDTTVFNRIAFQLSEIAKELRKANELMARQPTNPDTSYVGSATTSLKPKQLWPFPTNDRP